MKYFISLVIIFFSLNTISAQPKNPAFRELVGYTQQSCYLYAVKLYITEDTLFNSIRHYSTFTKDSVIYIAKASHITDWPDTLAGFKLKYVDIDAQKEDLYCGQKKSNIPVIYISRFVNNDDKWYCTILPVVFENDQDVNYGNHSCKILFTYDYTTARFFYTSTECTTHD